MNERRTAEFDRRGGLLPLAAMHHGRGVTVVELVGDGQSVDLQNELHIHFSVRSLKNT